MRTLVPIVYCCISSITPRLTGKPTITLGKRIHLLLPPDPPKSTATTVSWWKKFPQEPHTAIATWMASHWHLKHLQNEDGIIGYTKVDSGFGGPKF